MLKPIDIFIASYQRQYLTRKTLNYLYERTTYPFRVWLLDQEGTNESIAIEYEQKHSSNFMYLGFSHNIGIHGIWNVAAALAESEYFITSDNDIFVPDLKDTIVGIDPEENKWKKLQKHIGYGHDWLQQMVEFMDMRPDYGAISLHPHVFIGAAGIDPHDPEDVKERNMCGAVMRIMRRDAVQKAGGWEHKIEAGRNHEERTICSRLQTAGYKVGIATRIRAFHPFPPNWGYNKEFTPEMQKHNPDLEQYVQQFGNIENYDNKTWLPK